MRLYLSDAIDFVRARIDELSYNNDDMIVPSDDDRNFDTTVEELLPEAAEFIIRTAPASLLEPETEISVSSAGDDADGIESSVLKADGSIEVTFNISSGFLRLVSFKCDDSDIYVTEPVPFNSPKARMQANPYTKGTPDAPVLVERKSPDKVRYTYYSAENAGAGFTLCKIDRPTITEEGGGESIFCPEFLGPAVLNRLTGMVLDAYKELQYAQSFYQKSASYIA